MFVLPTISLLLISLGRAQAAPGASGLERRDNVSNAVALLVAAKESTFCSSVLGIKDVTITKTSVGPTIHITVTDPAAPCTKTAPANTLTSTSVVTLPAPVVSTTTTLVASTSSSFVTLSASTVVLTSTLPAVTDTSSVTLPVSTSTASTTVTPAPVSTTTTVTSTSIVTTTTITTYAINSVSNKRAAAPPTCNLKDLPPILELFACAIIQEACSIYVQPKTQTTTKTVPGSTYTSHTLAPCSCTTVTPSSSETTITSTITPSAVTSVATFTPPVSQVTSTITPPAVTVTTTTQLPDSSTSVTVTPPGTVVTSTITLPASTSTSTTTSVPLATSTVFDLGTTNTDNDCQAGSTPYNVGIPGATGSIVITCNGFAGDPFGSVFTATFNTFTDCVNNCLNSACDAVDWNIETGECIEYDGAVYNPSQNYGYNHMEIVISFD